MLGVITEKSIENIRSLVRKQKLPLSSEEVYHINDELMDEIVRLYLKDVNIYEGLEKIFGEKCILVVGPKYLNILNKNHKEHKES